MSCTKPVALRSAADDGFQPSPGCAELNLSPVVRAHAWLVFEVSRVSPPAPHLSAFHGAVRMGVKISGETSCPFFMVTIIATEFNFR